MIARIRWMGLGALAALSASGIAAWGLPAARTADDGAAGVKGWERGQGYGWIWGQDDEVGALNALSERTTREAVALVRQGRVYDLGVTYNRHSYKWPGHSPGEVITFRSPEGVKRQLDNDFIRPEVNPKGQAWHSAALFINDNVATQIDGLGHITAGEDNHWYNGFREADWGGNFGIRKCDAAGIPPIVTRGVMLDIAGLKGAEALPPHYGITPADVDRALAAQKVRLDPGNIVLLRTGTLRYWGADGRDVEKIAQYDTAGITLETARYLVENFGVVMIGSDTSGLEVSPAPADAGTFIPVHNYLLVEQGVYIGEFHNLEELARDKVYEFCYICATNKIAGTAAGFALRPLALR